MEQEVFTWPMMMHWTLQDASLGNAESIAYTVSRWVKYHLLYLRSYWQILPDYRTKDLFPVHLLHLPLIDTSPAFPGKDTLQYQEIVV